MLTFEEIKAADKAVIRFTAKWCGPCRALEPIFNEVAGENLGVKTFVVDVDQFRDIAQNFGIKGIPTVMLIENGSVKLQKSGAQPKEEIEEFFR